MAKIQKINQMQFSQRQIFQEQIQLLKIQIEQQNKRETKLRELIDTLTQQMQYQRQTQEQNYRLTQLNQKLMIGIKDARNKHIQEIKYYDDEILKLKEQIHDKSNQNERYRIEFQKKQLVFIEKTAMLESIIEKKCAKLAELEKKIHEDSISKLKQTQRQNSFLNPNLAYSRANPLSQKNVGPMRQPSSDLGISDLRISQISNNFDSENNMRASNISIMSKRSKGSEYSRMNKSQIKVMMGALIKSKKELQKGSQNIQEKSFQKTNKTVLN